MLIAGTPMVERNVANAGRRVADRLSMDYREQMALNPRIAQEYSKINQMVNTFVTRFYMTESYAREFVESLNFFDINMTAKYFQRDPEMPTKEDCELLYNIFTGSELGSLVNTIAREAISYDCEMTAVLIERIIGEPVMEMLTRKGLTAEQIRCLF